MVQRIALVGAGGMGKIHADCYNRIEEAQVVAVCDVNIDAAQKLADIYGVPAFTSLQYMISNTVCNAIDICLPTHLHLEYIEMSARAGKHICCEKPFCRTSEECTAAVKLCEEAGVSLFVAHVLRWFPEYRKAREMINDGRVGNPAVVRAWRGGGSRIAKGSWFANMPMSGGIILDLMIHDFDWLLWTFGPAERIFVRGLSNNPDYAHQDHALALIRFKSGLIGHVEATWAVPGEFCYGFEVAGDTGLVRFSNTEAEPLSLLKWKENHAASDVVVPMGEDEESPYLNELRSWVRHLEEGTELGVTPIEAGAAVDLAIAALESVKSGQPVSLGGGK